MQNKLVYSGELSLLSDVELQQTTGGSDAEFGLVGIRLPRPFPPIMFPPIKLPAPLPIEPVTW